MGPDGGGGVGGGLCLTVWVGGGVCVKGGSVCVCLGVDGWGDCV